MTAADLKQFATRFNNEHSLFVANPLPSGNGSQYAFTIYPTSSSPIPIITNEELILLRAEANIGMGSVAPAKADIDFIRVNSGGLVQDQSQRRSAHSSVASR